MKPNVCSWVGPHAMMGSCSSTHGPRGLYEWIEQDIWRRWMGERCSPGPREAQERFFAWSRPLAARPPDGPLRASEGSARCC